MLEVIIKNTADVCIQLEEYKWLFQNEIYELDSVISSLRSIKGLGDLCRKLRSVQDKMQEQAELLKNLESALNEIIICYENSEQYIIDTMVRVGGGTV